MPEMTVTEMLGISSSDSLGEVDHIWS